MGFLEQAGYAPDALDIAVETLDPAKVARARVVGISVPMHTALMLGVRVGEWVRAINPTGHLCFYGLYASLNAEYLLDHGADSVIGGEWETRSRSRAAAPCLPPGSTPASVVASPVCRDMWSGALKRPVTWLPKG
jgi:hypothetical protein